MQYEVSLADNEGSNGSSTAEQIQVAQNRETRETRQILRSRQTRVLCASVLLRSALPDFLSAANSLHLSFVGLLEFLSRLTCESRLGFSPLLATQRLLQIMVSSALASVIYFSVVSFYHHIIVTFNPIVLISFAILQLQFLSYFYLILLSTMSYQDSSPGKLKVKTTRRNANMKSIYMTSVLELSPLKRPI